MQYVNIYTYIQVTVSSTHFRVAYPFAPNTLLKKVMDTKSRSRYNTRQYLFTIHLQFPSDSLCQFLHYYLQHYIGMMHLAKAYTDKSCNQCCSEIHARSRNSMDFVSNVSCLTQSRLLMKKMAFVSADLSSNI